jgi:hypothetical protein
MGEKGSDITSGAFYSDRQPQRKHLSGAFSTEGCYTKNTKEEVEQMMGKLKKAADL